MHSLIILLDQYTVGLQRDSDPCAVQGTERNVYIARLARVHTIQRGGKRLNTRKANVGDWTHGAEKAMHTVAANNEIVFSSALGMADVEQGVPLKTSSVHRLASLSKPITGTIILDLVSQGKLSLDASIRGYLPELPKTYDSVTLRHLLDHQSGVG